MSEIPKIPSVGMYLVKVRPSGEKIIRDRLFIWEGGGLEQRKFGTRMAERRVKKCAAG